VSSAGRRGAPPAANTAPPRIAAHSVVLAAVLGATASFWTTLLQVYPDGAGAEAIVLLLLASSVLLFAAAVAAVAGIAQGAGGWTERLRRDALAASLAVLAALGALLLAAWAVTAEPGLQAPATALLAAAVLVATARLAQRAQPAPEWNLRRFSLTELQILVGVGMAVTLLLGLLARPWETASLTGAAALPTWQLTTVSLAVGIGAGQYVLQALRRPGAAVMALMVAFGVRALLIGLLQRPLGGFEGAAPAYLLALAPAGILDLVYLYNMRRADDARILWQALSSAVTATLLGGLLVLETLVAYPPVTSATIPGIIVAGAAAGFAVGWLGMVAGRWCTRPRFATTKKGKRNGSHSV
jgi:hypothetical protein